MQVQIPGVKPQLHNGAIVQQDHPLAGLVLAHVVPASPRQPVLASVALHGVAAPADTTLVLGVHLQASWMPRREHPSLSQAWMDDSLVFGVFCSTTVPDRSPIQRQQPGIARALDGATQHQTYVFAPSQPEWAYYPRPRQAPRWAPIELAASVTAPQTYEFPVNQPELRAYRLLAGRNLSQVEPIKRFEGPPIQQWFLFYPAEQSHIRGPETRQQPAPVVISMETAPVVPFTHIFTVQQPNLAQWPERTHRYYVRGPIEGPTVHHTYEYPVNQPEWGRFRNLLHQARYQVPAVPRPHQGAVVVPVAISTTDLDGSFSLTVDVAGAFTFTVDLDGAL
jgi:hypothetical protein